MRLEDLTLADQEYAGTQIISKLIALTNADQLLWERTVLGNVNAAYIEEWKFDFVLGDGQPHYLVVSNERDDACVFNAKSDRSLIKLSEAIYYQLEKRKAFSQKVTGPVRNGHAKIIDLEELTVSIEAKRRWNLMEEFIALCSELKE